MITLTVNNFSCLRHAEVTLGELTILIGPQASGKSIIAKLIYYFLSTLEYRISFDESNTSYHSFKAAAKETFIEWFPPSAWGPRPFTITFNAGELVIKISRVTYRNSMSENIRVWASDAVRTYYSDLSFAKQKFIKTSEDEGPELSLQLVIGVRKAARKLLAQAMGENYISSQVFIPAGRSFFTSLGRTLTAFEHGGLLDPFVLNFGKLYAQILDPSLPRARPDSKSSEFARKSITEIFGGKIRREGKNWVVITEDDRRIPMSALSSGQQELLPLLTVLPYLLSFESSESRLIYIEEPEAHLFPKAQSQLVEMLCSVASAKKSSTMMFITTHSPYVLSKFNNLALAGSLSSSLSPQKRHLLNKIVPVGKQVVPGSLRAYAITEGCVTDIVSEDGLISADYLDGISEEISTEFSQLLEVGYGD